MYYNQNYEKAVEKSSAYVIDFLQKNTQDWAVYHNLQHTIETVEGCNEIGHSSNLHDDEIILLNIAAWFHDTGYVKCVEGHEKKSVEIAENFLTKINFPKPGIVKISECIMATDISRNPEYLLGKIIRDADLRSLGMPTYFKSNNRLKLEIQKREGVKIREIDWLRRSEKFLLSHKYLTDYAISNYAPQKKINLKNLREYIKKMSL